MSQAGAQVASDQFSPPNLMNGSKPSKNFSGNRRKGSKPINSRRAFIGAIAVPVLFVMTASSNLKKPVEFFDEFGTIAAAHASLATKFNRRRRNGGCAISVSAHGKSNNCASCLPDK